MYLYLQINRHNYKELGFCLGKTESDLYGTFAD